MFGTVHVMLKERMACRSRQAPSTRGPSRSLLTFSRSRGSIVLSGSITKRSLILTLTTLKRGWYHLIPTFLISTNTSPSYINRNRMKTVGPVFIRFCVGRFCGACGGRPGRLLGSWRAGWGSQLPNVCNILRINPYRLCFVFMAPSSPGDRLLAPRAGWSSNTPASPRGGLRRWAPSPDCTAPLTGR